MTSLPWLDGDAPFPPAASALEYPNGLLAAGGGLAPARIIAAYRRGIFPWYSEGDPILWWSPDPRMVLYPGQLRVRRSLAQALRNRPYEVRLDTAFAQVIGACAATPRAGQQGTWISPEMMAAYQHLHEMGFAHSVETWIDGKLAGGLYGIALGSAFFGESMFAWQRDASKIALAHLCRFLLARGFGIIDCQMETDHLASLGASPIPRQDFLAALARLVPDDISGGRWPAGAIDGAFRMQGSD